MNNDPKLTVYLAGPINDCTDAECRDWRKRMQDEIPDINFLDPMRRDYRTPGSDQDVEAYTNIVESDKKDIDDSDVILVFHDRPSVGTSMEILYAFDNGKYILTVGCTGKSLSPWILYHSTKIVDTLDEAIEELKKIASQYSEFEVDNWVEDL